MQDGSGVSGAGKGLEKNGSPELKCVLKKGFLSAGHPVPPSNVHVPPPGKYTLEN